MDVCLLTTCCVVLCVWNEEGIVGESEELMSHTELNSMSLWHFQTAYALTCQAFISLFDIFNIF